MQNQHIFYVKCTKYTSKNPTLQKLTIIDKKEHVRVLIKTQEKGKT